MRNAKVSASADLATMFTIATGKWVFHLTFIYFWIQMVDLALHCPTAAQGAADNPIKFSADSLNYYSSAKSEVGITIYS